MKAPKGFSPNKDNWSVIVIDTTAREETPPSDGIWYNMGGLYIDLPIGIWDVDTQVYIFISNTGTQATVNTTLSTTNDGETDNKFTSGLRHVYTGNSGGTVISIEGTITRHIRLKVDTPTRYYFNSQSLGGTPVSLKYKNPTSPLIIRATSAYF
jgi:hypothetical protein